MLWAQSELAVSREFIQQNLRDPKIVGFVPFSEAAIDRREQLVRFADHPLIPPQPR